MRTLFAISLLLLSAAAGCWFFSPPASPVATPDNELQNIFAVGAREKWLAGAVVSLLFSFSFGLAGVKLWMQDRREGSF